MEYKKGKDILKYNKGGDVLENNNSEDILDYKKRGHIGVQYR